MIWFILIYLMFGFGVAVGFCDKGITTLDIEIDGFFLVVWLFFPVFIGAGIGQKLK